MGFLQWLAGKIHPGSNTEASSKSRSDGYNQNFDYKQLKSEFNRLWGQMSTIHMALCWHEQALDRHMEMIRSNSKKEAGLEQKLNSLTSRQISKPQSSIYQTDKQPEQSEKGFASQPDDQMPGNDNLERFSQQEKRILSVFFEHPQMPLSYRDIGRVLGKSAHTVKNQMRQIRMKRRLFDINRDHTNRNRFRLKKGLKIEKYLSSD